MEGQICKSLIHYDIIILLLWIHSDSESFMSAVGCMCVYGGWGHLLLLLIWLYDVILSFRLHFRSAHGNVGHKHQ